MKYFAMMILALTAMTTFASATEVELNAKKIQVGALGELQAGSELTVIRTSATPDKVKLEVSYLYHATVCIKREWERNCYGPIDVIGSNCFYRDYCVAWDTLQGLTDEQETIELDFKKAGKLADGIVERIELDLAMDKMNRLGVTVDQATGDAYEVKGQYGRKLKFRAR